MKLQNYINHIAFVVDESSSMSGIRRDLVKVFDNQIAHLALRSKELDQETRVSVYTFGNTVNCLVFDMDVLRMPSIDKFYKPYGWTALLDGTKQAIVDLQKTPQLYGDHAFLAYVLTDGEENRSKTSAQELSKLINSLADNWTVAVMVPDQNGVFEAKKHGFPASNISVWDATSSKGVSEAGSKMNTTIDRYMTGRATGVRGTKSFFELNTNISTKDVQNSLKVLSASDYTVLNVRKDGPIRETVELWMKTPYRNGSSYYQLTKKEKIQANKNILIKNKMSGKVYSGAEARKMLNLPDYEVAVAPADFKDFYIFVQSTSVNRKLIAGTELIVIV